MPNGTKLSTVHGDQTYGRRGQVISGKDIQGCVQVTAPDVTIKNTKISCQGSALDYEGDSNAGRLTLENVTITCGGTGGSSGIGEYFVTVIRADVSGCENGFDADHDVTVKDSYIHDLFMSSQSHTDGLQSCCGTRLSLTHSVWYSQTDGVDGTSSLIVSNDHTDGRPLDTLIEKNLFAGGSYSVYCPRASVRDYQVVDNVFSRIFDEKVAAYGPTDSCHGAGIGFTGNIYDNGAAVPANS